MHVVWERLSWHHHGNVWGRENRHSPTGHRHSSHCYPLDRCDGYPLDDCLIFSREAQQGIDGGVRADGPTSECVQLLGTHCLVVYEALGAIWVLHRLNRLYLVNLFPLEVGWDECAVQCTHWVLFLCCGFSALCNCWALPWGRKWKKYFAWCSMENTALNKQTVTSNFQKANPRSTCFYAMMMMTMVIIVMPRWHSFHTKTWCWTDWECSGTRELSKKNSICKYPVLSKMDKQHQETACWVLYMLLTWMGYCIR